MADATAAVEPFVGKVLSERRFTVTDATLADYFKGLNIEPRADGRVPSMIASEPDNIYFGEIAFSNHVGHLWMRQEWEFKQPLQAGTSYSVGGEIREIYQRRDRNVVKYEVVLRDDAGNVVLTSQHHQSFLQEKPASGEVSFRDPNKKPGARKFIVPEGDRFGGFERKITLAMCGDYFHGDANYHTDEAASRELGFRDVVVGGRMTMAYAAHIMEQQFGDAWWTSGRLDLKFTNPTWADDVVTAHGVVTGPLPDDPSRTGVFLWLSKPDDTIVLVGDASVGV